MARAIQKTLQLRGAHPYLMQLKIPLKTRSRVQLTSSHVQPHGNPFCIPENLGILPPLWLQARLTLSLTVIQEKFARILLSVACEPWLRGQIASVEDVLLQTARALTIRLAEKLAQAMSSL